MENFSEKTTKEKISIAKKGVTTIVIVSLIKIVFGLMALMYLSASCIHWNLNMGEWHIASRIIFAILSALIIVIFVISYINSREELMTKVENKILSLEENQEGENNLVSKSKFQQRLEDLAKEKGINP
jgi:Tfp pilus assembly protein PilO